MPLLASIVLAVFSAAKASNVPYTTGARELRGFVDDNEVFGDAIATPFRSLTSAEDTEPTLDEVDSVIFSRPPYSNQEESMLVYYTVAGCYVLCSLLLLVGANLDAVERRKRQARAIVPQNYVVKRFLCCRITVPQESVPSEVAEQYFLDGRLLALRSPEEVISRKQKRGLTGYLWHNLTAFFDVVLREHALFSFVPKAIPTFSRTKRAFLLVVQIHFCLIVAGVVYNVREHHSPDGVYRLLYCSESDSNPGVDGGGCFATVPAALIAAAVATPVFRYTVFQHFRLTCFVPQSHPTSAPFPLGLRKFAALPPRSVVESMLCMRNGRERQKARVTQSRRAAHRVVQTMWESTRISINNLRFYSTISSTAMCGLLLAFVVGVAIYILTITIYLKDSVVYHWLTWFAVMICSWIFFLEPLLLFWTQVLWASIVQTVVQRYGFGSHALAATSKYKSILKEVDETVLVRTRKSGAIRIQRWWKGLVRTRQQAGEQTEQATHLQTDRKKDVASIAYLKDRKWCLRVEVVDCAKIEALPSGFKDATFFVKFRCDANNPNVSTTKPLPKVGEAPIVFNEHFFVDIKDSNALVVEFWSRRGTSEELLGSGQFAFQPLRLREAHQTPTDGHPVEVRLMKESAGKSAPAVGLVHFQVQFLDPLNDECGNQDEDDWMLPKNRMKFALSRMGPGNKKNVGKMLGNLPTQGAEGASGSAGDGSLPVLTGDEYLADNTGVKTETDGLAYRSRKVMTALVKPHRALLWGTKVRGVEESDGWLRVGDAKDAIYLPMKLEGVQVLKLVEPGQGSPKPSQSGGSPSPREMLPGSVPEEPSSQPHSRSASPKAPSPAPPSNSAGSRGPSKDLAAAAGGGSSPAGSRSQSHASASASASASSSPPLPPPLSTSGSRTTSKNLDPSSGSRPPAAAPIKPKIGTVSTVGVVISKAHHTKAAPQGGNAFPGFVPEDPDEL